MQNSRERTVALARGAALPLRVFGSRHAAATARERARTGVEERGALGTSPTPMLAVAGDMPGRGAHGRAAGALPGPQPARRRAPAGAVHPAARRPAPPAGTATGRR